jgi:hypothetical protein
LGVDAGYDPPWVWADHVKVYPCAKEGWERWQITN